MKRPYGKYEFSHKTAILEETFRVWCRNQVNDYQAILTPVSLILLPLTPRAAKQSCCKLCSHVARIEIPGRDIVACRPSNGVALNTRFNMGPPVFMLITYPTWSRSTSRVVLYFHWTRLRGSRHFAGSDGSSGYDSAMDRNVYTESLVSDRAFCLLQRESQTYVNKQKLMGALPR